jgi:hypothetical protein
MTSPTQKTSTHRLRRYALILFATGLSQGCADLGVKAHQRGLLAQKSMLLTADPVEAGLDDHTYFSKEASSGGRGFGGGGCGCN